MKKILLLLLVCFTTQSCFIGRLIQTPKMEDAFSEKNNAIPANFDKNATILVIVKGRGSYDRYLKKAVKKNFKGNYVFIKSEDLDSGNYSDTSKFRYVFDYTNGRTQTTQFSNGQTASSTWKVFYLYDRLENSNYSSGKDFSNFGLALKIYWKNIESKRLS
jgi:hypothetical protein